MIFHIKSNDAIISKCLEKKELIFIVSDKIKWLFCIILLAPFNKRMLSNGVQLLSGMAVSLFVLQVTQLQLRCSHASSVAQPSGALTLNAVKWATVN